jgi:hypothetical protein
MSLFSLFFVDHNLLLLKTRTVVETNDFLSSELLCEWVID